MVPWTVRLLAGAVLVWALPASAQTAPPRPNLVRSGMLGVQYSACLDTRVSDDQAGLAAALASLRPEQIAGAAAGATASIEFQQAAPCAVAIHQHVCVGAILGVMGDQLLAAGLAGLALPELVGLGFDVKGWVEDAVPGRRAGPIGPWEQLAVAGLAGGMAGAAGGAAGGAVRGFLAPGPLAGPIARTGGAVFGGMGGAIAGGTAGAVAGTLAQAAKSAGVAMPVSPGAVGGAVGGGVGGGLIGGGAGAVVGAKLQASYSNGASNAASVRAGRCKDEQTMLAFIAPNLAGDLARVSDVNQWNAFLDGNERQRRITRTQRQVLDSATAAQLEMITRVRSLVH